MFNWVMGGIVAGLGNLSTSKIVINTFSTIERVGVAGFLTPKSTTVIINTYITPIVTIIITYMLPLFTIIATYVTPLIAMNNISYSLIFMNIFVNRKRIK